MSDTPLRWQRVLHDLLFRDNSKYNEIERLADALNINNSAVYASLRAYSHKHMLDKALNLCQG